MFEVGQKVAYGIHGVCAIIGTEVRKVDKKNVEYFVLEPMRHPGTYYYIPTQNPNALAKLRELVTMDRLNRLAYDDLYSWNDNENQRKQSYRQLLNNVDCCQLISAIRVVERQRDELLKAGKKFHQCDESFLRDAERLVYEELALLLPMETNDIHAFIMND